MSRHRSTENFNLLRLIQKFFLSSFVVLTFVAYVIHERLVKPGSPIGSAPTISAVPAPQLDPSSNPGPGPAAYVAPTVAIQPTAALLSGQYRDGVYTGPQIDAYYGYVEVQATIQNGRIADVQFLQYPNDRRTSIEINNIAMPYLQQEAIQAQSAHVNIISGATFTSEGFAISLNEALRSAQN